MFSDAPKRAEDARGVEEVRKVVRSRNWCGKVRVIEREQNYGCARNIIDGVTKVCNEYGKVIVVEDDLILSQHFLEYMNESLLRYEQCEQVMQISAYMFPCALEASTDAVFLPLSTSWGWGIWKRAWDKFDPLVSRYNEIKSDKEMLYRFNLNGSYPYYPMLEAQLNGQVDSWAIRFYYAVFLNKGLVLHPKASLVSNIGFDGSGTHCSVESMNSQLITSLNIAKHPDEIVEDTKAKVQVYRYLYRNNMSRSMLNDVIYEMKLFLQK